MSDSYLSLANKGRVIWAGIAAELLMLDPENANANNYFFKSKKGNRTDLLRLDMPFAIKKE